MAAVPAETFLVVIGASAGGVGTLLELAEGLPPGFPAPICIVQHVGTHVSLLPELLSARGRHPAVHAQDRQLLTPGVIHVAPPDHHLLVEGNKLRLLRGPRENHARPAIDPLFRSAALEWGARVIGVVLTGMLDDGTAGLKAVKERGGIAVVEDPRTAYEPSMPRSALENVQVDHCVPVGEMGALLGQLVGLSPQPAVVEDALRASVRALVEREMLLRRTAAIAAATGDTQQADAGLREADRLRGQVEALRGITESERSRLGDSVPA